MIKAGKHKYTTTSEKNNDSHIKMVPTPYSHLSLFTFSKIFQDKFVSNYS